VFWRVDKATGVLRCLDQWTAPSVQADPFTQDTGSVCLHAARVCLDVFWASGKSAWVTDVTVDDNFPRGAQARHVGFHGAFGLPILVGSEIEGVIEFFKPPRAAAR